MIVKMHFTDRAVGGRLRVKGRSCGWSPCNVALVIGSIVITLSMGIRQVFGLLLLPVTMSLAMSRETFGLVIGLQNLLWGVTQPFAGFLADRFGAGRVIAVGGLLYAAGLALGASSVGPGSLGRTIGALARA